MAPDVDILNSKAKSRTKYKKDLGLPRLSKKQSSAQRVVTLWEGGIDARPHSPGVLVQQLYAERNHSTRVKWIATEELVGCASSGRIPHLVQLQRRPVFSIQP